MNSISGTIFSTVAAFLNSGDKTMHITREPQRRGVGIMHAIATAADAANVFHSNYRITEEVNDHYFVGGQVKRVNYFDVFHELVPENGDLIAIDTTVQNFDNHEAFSNFLDKWIERGGRFITVEA